MSARDGGAATDPVAAICEVVMQRFAVADRAAGPDSPLARARARLGAGYLDVVIRVLRANVIAALSGPGAEETLRAVETCGQIGATMVVVSIVADALTAIIAEASDPA